MGLERERKRFKRERWVWSWRLREERVAGNYGHYLRCPEQQWVGGFRETNIREKGRRERRLERERSLHPAISVS
jgi:hypothetical protein